MCARVKDSAILWTMLALARLYLATVQTGYIHPDEFHQSVQVMAREYNREAVLHYVTENTCVFCFS